MLKTTVCVLPARLSLDQPREQHPEAEKHSHPREEKRCAEPGVLEDHRLAVVAEERAQPFVQSVPAKEESEHRQRAQRQVTHHRFRDATDSGIPASVRNPVNARKDSRPER